MGPMLKMEVRLRTFFSLKMGKLTAHFLADKNDLLVRDKKEKVIEVSKKK